MKTIKFLILFIFFNTITTSAQIIYPKGVYMSYDEIINKSPSQNYNLTIEKRTIGDIKMNGGNDYKLISNDESLNKKYLKTMIYAYSDGENLYLNCYQYKVQNWYADLISDGKYLVFKGGLSQNVDEQKKQIKIGTAFGAIGGGIQGAKLATLRFVYAIDKSNNNLIYITPEKLENLLWNYTELYDNFQKENDKNEETIIKYLKLLNETT